PGSANADPGSPSDVGTRGSGPATTERRRARSPTLRAIGPVGAVGSQKLSGGQVGARPREGRRPTTPQNGAGVGRGAPMSGPAGGGSMRRRSEQAAPPLDPPAERVGSTGFSVVPNTVLKVWEPAANSGVLVLPMGTAPAARIRSTIRKSLSG